MCLNFDFIHVQFTDKGNNTIASANAKELNHEVAGAVLYVLKPLALPLTNLDVQAPKLWL